MTDILQKICSNIWETWETPYIWPDIWTKSFNHASKVMLKIIKNHLQPHADRIIAEEQTGFMKDRSTIKQIFILRILCEKLKKRQCKRMDR